LSLKIKKTFSDDPDEDLQDAPIVFEQNISINNVEPDDAKQFKIKPNHYD